MQSTTPGENTDNDFESIISFGAQCAGETRQIPASSETVGNMFRFTGLFDFSLECQTCRPSGVLVKLEPNETCKLFTDNYVIKQHLGGLISSPDKTGQRVDKEPMLSTRSLSPYPPSLTSHPYVHAGTRQLL